MEYRLLWAFYHVRYVGKSNGAEEVFLALIICGSSGGR
jgi:hypothetical protein